MDKPVVLFDGTCNFCDRSVHFVLDHERASDLVFAPLQSEAASELLKAAPPDVKGSDSVVLVEGGEVYTQSTAALRVARYLRAPWRWFRIFVLVPRPVR